MIISKTPLRMSYVGGGSDLPSYYKEEMGAVISTSIDKYVYVAVNSKFDGKIRLSYSRTEEVDDIDQISHPLVRECLRHVGVGKGIEISSLADIPSSGTGLGSSSSYTVGLLNALHAYTNRYISKLELAGVACNIEIERCREPIGKQDQYAAAFGGMNLIRFHQDERVSVEPIICKPSTLETLQSSTLIFYTGLTRSASQILAKQSNEILQPEKRKLVQRMVNLAFEMKKELEANSLDSFGEILNENWNLKTRLSDGISNPQIDDWYSMAMRSGATGGKLLGAGAGGFLMFYAPQDRHGDIVKSLKGLRQCTFRYDCSGAQIVFYQPRERE
jgi:D-glycero-alpha-D-manno-heptose-7-phosphate kinase